MATTIAYKLLTTATGKSGQPIKFQTLDRDRAIKRRDEVRGDDPKARIIGIPVSGR